MAEHDATPPPDGFYWFHAEDGEPVVVEVARGMFTFSGDEQHWRLPSWPAKDGCWPAWIEGRILGRVQEPGQQPAAYMSPDGTRTMPAVIFDDWKAQRPDDAAGWVAMAPIVQPGPINHADLLRRYFTMVVAQEGCTLLPRADDGYERDGIKFTAAEVAYLDSVA